MRRWRRRRPQKEKGEDVMKMICVVSVEVFIEVHNV